MKSSSTMVQRSENTVQMYMDAKVFLSICWPSHAIVEITYDNLVLCIKSENLSNEWPQHRF